MIPKSLWGKRHQPELFTRAARICEYQDFINWRLTRRWVASLNNMAIRWHYQSREGAVPRSLIEKLGLSDLEEKWPSHLHLGVAARPVHAPGVWGTYMDAVYPDKPIIEGGQTSTGSVIAWFKRHFASQTTFDALNEEAAKIEPGCEGLLVLDHFVQGNRTPYTDALSRGAITGLTLKHTPAHVYRAIIEGICLGTKLIVENFGGAFQARRIVVAGGATHSPLWLQIHADTIGAPLELTEVPDAPALGCAVLAARGAERFSTIEEGAKAMVRTARTIGPNEANARRYDAFYPQYRELYAALKKVRVTDEAAIHLEARASRNS